MTTYIPRLTFPDAVFASPAASILLPVLCGTVIGYTQRPKEVQSQYADMRQPPLRPPPYVFGPVWTALYGVMGYTAHRAFTIGMASPSPSVRAAARHGATLYTIQLGLNLVWMPLFFGYNKPIAATADIVALTGTVGYLAYVWGQVDTTSAYLLAPYIAWLSFATYLCAGSGYLNDWDLESKRKPKTS